MGNFFKGLIKPNFKKLKRLLLPLKKHQGYYYTSWTYWDGTFQPKQLKSNKVLAVWSLFLNQKVTHIFAVSQTAKQSLIENYRILSDKISVVNHTIHPAFLKEFTLKKEPKTFLYYGRLVPQKGIMALLTYFKEHPRMEFTIIGDGALASEVITCADTYSNVHYLAKMDNLTL